MRTMLRAVAGFGALAFAAPTAVASPILAQQAQTVLSTYCHRCHGKDGANEGGFNYVLDMSQLVQRRKVIAGDPAKSRLLRRLRNENDPMPPPDEKPRPTKADIALIEKWIEAGAPGVDDAKPAAQFLSAGDMLRTIEADLEAAPMRDRPFLRYFTLTHLHNAGLSGDEIQSFRHGLSKLINSLSWGKRIVVPRAIDPDKTILAIDLRDVEWTDKTWETIVARNPYGLQFDFEAAKACAALTKCELPYVRGDWFVAAAARPPLYHDILQLARSEAELEKLLRVDVLENLRQERVARAGFNSSGVSRNNRLIERHEAGGTVYWKSYDFGGNTGRQNLFAHPLGPHGDDQSFQHDGGEIIFSLPNGLQAYFLTDGKGQRIDKGPTSIVSDPRRPDRAVENGLSCMTCHARGIIEKNDQVRTHVFKNPKAFAASTVDTVEALYPPSDKMTALMRADAKRFQEAVAKTGAPLSATEPIAALAERFEAELDITLLAAEAGVTPPVLLKALDRYPHLAKLLGPLSVEGGTVQRSVFVDSFPELADALRLGRHLASGAVAAERLIRTGQKRLANNLVGALQAFQEAAQRDPDNAFAHAGQGDVFRLKGQYAQAVAAYSAALRCDPRQATVYNSRALMFQQQGELDRALDDYGAALRLDPRFAVAYHNRGTAHYAKGELDRAIADYDEALRLDGQFARAFNNRGYAYLDKEDYPRAIADFDRALKLEPKFAVAFNNRGLANLRQNRLDKAIADFSAAIAIDDKFAGAYFNRGVAHAKQGDAVLAAADRKRAVVLDPTVDRD